MLSICSHSSSSCSLLSVFFTADVTQKTVTLAIHSEEPVTVSNSPLDSYLLERQLICTRSHKHTPLLFLAILSLCLSLFLSPLSFSLSLSPLSFHFHSSAQGRWSILALWHQGRLFGDRMTCRENVKCIRGSE